MHQAREKVSQADAQVGNFRVEPPGLFRGRGEHPRMGKVKQRIYPRDITINIGQPMSKSSLIVSMENVMSANACRLSKHTCL